MSDLARILISMGVVMILVGVLFLFFDKIPGLGKLPGDILIKNKNTSFYFPLTTCILISVIISFIMYLWNQK